MNCRRKSNLIQWRKSTKHIELKPSLKLQFLICFVFMCKTIRKSLDWHFATLTSASIPMFVVEQKNYSCNWWRFVKLIAKSWQSHRICQLLVLFSTMLLVVVLHTQFKWFFIILLLSFCYMLCTIWCIVIYAWISLINNFKTITLILVLPEIYFSLFEKKNVVNYTSSHGATNATYQVYQKRVTDLTESNVRLSISKYKKELK